MCGFENVAFVIPELCELHGKVLDWKCWKGLVVSLNYFQQFSPNSRSHHHYHYYLFITFKSGHPFLIDDMRGNKCSPIGRKQYITHFDPSTRQSVRYELLLKSESFASTHWPALGLQQPLYFEFISIQCSMFWPFSASSSSSSSNGSMFNIHTVSFLGQQFNQIYL